MNPQLRAIVVGALGVIGGVALVLVLANAGSKEDSGIEIRLGDKEFNAGEAVNQAAEVVENGPITYPDLADRNRPIWLQHLGDDPYRGWYAFDALVAGGETCAVNYEPDTEEFVDCDGARYLPDGTGLRQYPVRIDGGDLVINLNASLERSPGDNEVVDTP